MDVLNMFDTHIFMRMGTSPSIIPMIANKVSEAIPLPPIYQVGVVVFVSFTAFLTALYWAVMYVQPCKYKYLGELVDNLNNVADSSQEQRIKVETSLPVKEANKEEAGDSPPSMIAEPVEISEDETPLAVAEEIKTEQPSPKKAPPANAFKTVLFTVKMAEKANELQKAKKLAEKKLEETPEDSSTADESSMDDDDDRENTSNNDEPAVLPRTTRFQTPTKPARRSTKGTLFTPNGRRSARLMRKKD